MRLKPPASSARVSPASRGAARRSGAAPLAPTAPTKAKLPRGARPRRGGGPQARRSGPRLPLPRLGIPAGRRLAAVVAAAALAAVLAYLVNGPWLRIGTVAWGGTRYTPPDDVAAILEPLRGTSLLALDDRALSQRLAALPAIADARVETLFPGGVQVSLDEKPAVLLWQTSAVRLVVAADGVVFGEVALAARIPSELARLPLIDDRRGDSRNIIIGDRIPAQERTIALRLVGLDPAAMGSAANALRVRLDERCGYVIAPTGTEHWSAALGRYDTLPAGVASPEARIQEQVGAIRTLFSAHDENTVAWVDARNPGKVYWRPNGPSGSGTC